MSATEQAPSTESAAIASPDELRIFVGNLPLSADAKLLKSLFREGGIQAKVDAARVYRSPSDKGRYAIVAFKTADDKSKGVEALTKKFEGASEGGAPKADPATEAAAEPAAETEADSAADTTPAAAQKGEPKSTKLRFGVAPLKPKAPADKKTSAKKKGAAQDGEKPAGQAVAAEGVDGSSAPKQRPSPKTKRPAATLVPRPSAVYVTLPAHTEADEVRELLSGFPSVEIKLGHKRGRTVTRRTRQIEIPDRTYAVVTVGEEHQQRAIEQLDGKELREFRITAKPSSQRLINQDALEEARAAKKADDAAPEVQPKSEHAEHAEQTEGPGDNEPSAEASV